MGYTHEEVARRWVNVVLGYTSKRLIKNHNFYAEGDTLYSYGSHFVVAELHRDKKGNPDFFLLNGDRFSNTTDKHQSEARSAVRGAVRSVIIPFSALNSAGVDRKTIELIESEPDRTEEIVITSRKEPVFRYMGTRRSSPFYSQNSKTWELREERDAWGTIKQEVCNCPEWQTPKGMTFTEKWDWERDQKSVHMRARHGIWERLERPILGDGYKEATYSTHISWNIEDAPITGGDWLLTRTQYVHRLGGSLIRAEVEQTVRSKCKDCAGTGVLTYEGVEGRCSCRNGFRLAYRKRKVMLLSGFDENETRPSYYLCELPKGVKPQTVREALECLKPQAVKIAEQAGREVKRQGDIFAIPLTALPEKVTKDAIIKRGNLLNTNHAATEVVHIGKQTYARGTMRHVPEGRRPDHKMLRLGREWHLIVKNTVPLG